MKKLYILEMLADQIYFKQKLKFVDQCNIRERISLNQFFCAFECLISPLILITYSLTYYYFIFLFCSVFFSIFSWQIITHRLVFNHRCRVKEVRS